MYSEITERLYIIDYKKFCWLFWIIKLKKEKIKSLNIIIILLVLYQIDSKNVKRQKYSNSIATGNGHPEAHQSRIRMGDVDKELV